MSPSAMEKPTRGFTLEQIGSSYAICAFFANLFNQNEADNSQHAILNGGDIVRLVGVLAEGTIAVVEDAHGCRINVSATTDFYYS